MDETEEYELDYTVEDILEIGEEKDDEYKISVEEATKRLVWLACWFLKGIVGSDVWKKEVTSPTLHPHLGKKNFFKWAHTTDVAFLCVVYIQNYKRWQEEDKQVRKLGRNEVLTKTQKENLETMTVYGRDGVSSVTGGLKFAKLHYYVKENIKKVPENNKKFDEAFWKYNDEHCEPLLREKEQGTLTLPDDDPETTRKRKEAEKVRMWENSLAADDDESF